MLKKSSLTRDVSGRYRFKGKFISEKRFKQLSNLRQFKDAVPVKAEKIKRRYQVEKGRLVKRRLAETETRDKKSRSSIKIVTGDKSEKIPIKIVTGDKNIKRRTEPEKNFGYNSKAERYTYKGKFVSKDKFDDLSFKRLEVTKSIEKRKGQNWEYHNFEPFRVDKFQNVSASAVIQKYINNLSRQKNILDVIITVEFEITDSRGKITKRRESRYVEDMTNGDAYYIIGSLSREILGNMSAYTGKYERKLITVKGQTVHQERVKSMMVRPTIIVIKKTGRK